MNIHFDQPKMLLVALVAVPLLVVGWSSLRRVGAFRRVTALTLRLLLVVALAVLLARPHVRREHDHLTVIGLLDISGSVQRFARLPDADAERQSYMRYLREWFRTATQTRAPDDRFGLVVFDGEAVAVSAPTKTTLNDLSLQGSTVSGTNMDEAIRLGLAMFPPDTARRLVLVTDGNETIGDALTAARQAASSDVDAVPIDIVPVLYTVQSDAQIVRIEAPSQAQPGQTATVRLTMETTQPMTGRLSLRREGRPVDLNGAAPGRSRRVELPAGRSVHLASVTLDDTPVNRFDAVFEPDDPSADALPDNNRAEAFTATPGRGDVLIVSPEADPEASVLGQVLFAAGMQVVVRPPALLPTDLLGLQNHDLVVLDNVAAFEITSEQDELLSRYVNDLGGGLIMIGGDDGFGAGGWNGTAVESVLPLELDPPKELRLPQAALVLVLDQSGSMNRPVGGARATQQEVANEAAAMAIESLRHESYVGVVTFNTAPRRYIELQRNDDPTLIAQRVRRIVAGGGTDLGPALRLAHDMLRGVDADRKRVVCLTDGQSPTGGLDAIVERMHADGIKLSTIAVGDEADHETLKRLSEIGEGEFFPVFNPRALPRFLVDAVQSINKPLLKESPFVPQVLPTGSLLTLGFEDVPSLGGLVVTAPRPEARPVIELVHPDGEPLLAHWQAGLGRVAAFTSDFGGRWSSDWLDWPTAASFWTQLARTIARPAVNQDAELMAIIDDGRLDITLDASEADDGFLDYLDVTGTVYRPDGTSVAVRLRQVGPGRYETSVPARNAGNYIVALTPRRGQRQLAPVIGGASVNTGEEYRRYESNAALLDRIMTITQGRRLDLGDPAGADLFDHAGMRRSVSLLPAWRTVIAIAIALLLLDVASRRIAWSVAAAVALVRRALVRITPAHRGHAAAATLASLREVSTHFDERRATKTRGLKPLEPLAPVPPPARDFTETPEPSRVSSAIASIFGRRGTSAPPAETQAPEPSEDHGGATETTSGLLEAKRRARKRLGE